MKERMEVIDFKYKIAFCTFLFFLIIGVLAPISGVDWANYSIGKVGLLESLPQISVADGNPLSSILIPFLTYHKILFDFLFAVFMGLFVYTCNSLMGIVKNKYYYILPFLFSLLVSVPTFAYNYVSVSTTVTFTFPSILVFLYFGSLWKKENPAILSGKEILSYLLLSIAISLLSIHIGVVFFLGNVLYYLCSRKNISKKYLIVLLGHLLAVVGAFTFVDKPFFYAEKDMLFSMESHLSVYISTIFSKNILLFLIGAIPINYYLFDKMKNSTYSRVVVTLFYSILLFSFGYNFFNYSPVNLNLVLNKYNGVFAVENWYYIFYFILYFVLLFFTIRHFVGTRKTRRYLTVTFFMSILLSFLQLVSPIWDEGNTIFIVLFLILSISLMMKERDIKIFSAATVLITILLTVYYGVMFALSKYIDFTRESYIQEQLAVDQEIIEVKANPLYLVYRYNPITIFQHKDFKDYYHIPEEKAIEVKYFGIFEKIEKKVKE